MLCHPEPHPAVNYALRNVKSRLNSPDLNAVSSISYGVRGHSHCWFSGKAIHYEFS